MKALNLILTHAKCLVIFSSILILSGCWVEISSSNSDENGVDINSDISSENGVDVNVIFENSVIPEQSDAVTLAKRILQWKSVNLLIEIRSQQELISEIDQILKRTRNQHPEIADISAVVHTVPKTLIVSLEADLLRTVSEILSHGSGTVKLHTGNSKFDSLNERLGLVTVRPIGRSGSFIFYFDNEFNILLATFAYNRVDGVEYVQPDYRLGDYSDIELVKLDGTWYIVFRKAWGDCPSGCIFQELTFFTVKGTEVEQINDELAMEMGEFDEIIKYRKWD